MSKKHWLDEYYHYHRTCLGCGKNWWGLHCPHDGYQNPCSKCGLIPATVLDPDCNCEFVAPIQAILDTIKSKLPEEKVWDMGMDETGGEVEAWNECLKAVKQALLGEK